jgi:hypothetical protein
MLKVIGLAYNALLQKYENLLYAHISELPSIVGKGLIGFGHLMRVLSFFYRSTTVTGSIHEFTG